MVRGYRMGTKSVTDARRPSNKREPKKIYYIFSEGFQTEQIYFEALAKHEILKTNIEIKPCKRLKINSGESNQRNVVVHINEYIKEVKNIKNADKTKIKEYSTKYENKSINYLELKQLIMILEKIKSEGNLSETESLIEQLEAIAHISGYDKSYDKICIVLDRDPDSFSEEQYEEALQICQDQDYIFGLSNPNFEFFLLLHLRDLTEFNKSDLKNNNIGGKFGLTEAHLKEVLNEDGLSFKKNNFNGDYFINNIKTGISNSLIYERQEEKLKDNIGTNLFNIIQQIIN